MNTEGTGEIKSFGKSENLQDANTREATSTVSDLLFVSTAQSPTVETTPKSQDGIGADNEVVRRKRDDDDNWINYITRLVRRLSPKDTWFKQLDDVLKELPICLYSNESVLHFDPRKQICCDGIVNKTTDHQQCCKGTVIDDRTHICCNKTIREKSDVNGCCGVFVYDKTEQLCCSGSLYPLLQNMACCGNGTFNNKTDMCCNGNLQPAHGIRNKKGACCNNTSYHDACHECDSSLKLSARYDESTTICCNGKVIQRLHGNSSGCCHRRIINTDLHACIENTVVPKTTLGLDTDNSTPTLVLPVTEDENNITVIVEEQEELLQGRTVAGIAAYSIGIGCVSGAIFLVCIGAKIFCKKRAHLLFKEILNCQKEASVENTASTQRMIQTVSDEVTATEDTAKDKKDIEESESRYLLEEIGCPEVDATEKDTYINDAVSTEEGGGILPEGPSFKSTDISFPNIKNLIQKQEMMNDSNCLKNYFKDSNTQTGSNNFTFRRTIFGQKFEYKFMLDETNSSLLIPNSDVTLTLPESVIKEQVEVNCSSFSSLPDLRQKLGLSEDEAIASSVAEFVITGHSALPEHAIVVLPFVGKASGLVVKKFKSDEGLNTVATSIEIPERTKENVDLDVCYTIEGSSVIVYAKTFSGFYCTKNRHRRDVDLSLRAFIFGSYKRINKKYEVGVSAYIADKIFELKSYKKRMLENEVKRQERVLLKDIPLLMPKCDLDDQDSIEAYLPVENGWMHRRHPSKNRPIQDERKEIRLEYIAQKCKKCPNFNPHELEIPFCTEWYITTTGDITPSEIFQFTVDLNICKREPECKKENSIFIEKLALRDSDRLPIKEDYIRAMAPIQPVQESCSNGPNVLATGRSETQRPRIEQIQMMSLGNRMHNDSALVRGERSRLPVYSYNETDLRHVTNSRPGLRQHPNPEMSAPIASDQFQGLNDLSQSNSEDSCDLNI